MQNEDDYLEIPPQPEPCPDGQHQTIFLTLKDRKGARMCKKCYRCTDKSLTYKDLYLIGLFADALAEESNKKKAKK